MADVDTLEAALLERWDPATLAVYADCLQSRGDPRGELIALDLEIAAHGYTHALGERRRQRLYEWLGRTTDDTGDSIAWDFSSFRYGFAENFVAYDPKWIETLFASPAGRFVRGLTLRATSPGSLRDQLAVVSREPRPWLERLDLTITERSYDGVPATPVEAAIAATPRLRDLAVRGESTLAFPHPNVRTLFVESRHLEIATRMSIDSLAVQIAPLGHTAPIADAVARRPLRLLDLSINEPPYPSSSQLSPDIYALAETLPLQRVATLHMPSLRTEDQVRCVRQMLATHPQLTITVAETYAQHRAVRPTIERLQLPPPRSWPPPDTLSSRDALTITIPSEEYGEDLGLRSLLDTLEACWRDLPASSKAAWLDFWAFLDDLPWEDEKGHTVTKDFPAATLLAAVEPLEDLDGRSGWAQLAEKLREANLPPDGTVGLARYWGW